MQFAKILEHDAFKSILRRIAVTNQVPHAQLFVGPLGSANLALALAFATYLNCSARKKNDACGTCSSCATMLKLIHPDLLLIFPKKATTIFSEAQSDKTYLEKFRNCVRDHPFLTLEEWASLIDYDGKQCQISKKEVSKVIQQLSLKPFIGPYKIVVIWLPEYLHQTAAHALLKTLEEPPPHSVFLLVGSNSQKILPTMRSRVQQHMIPPFSEEAIEQLLRDKYTHLDSHRYKEITFLAEGNLSKAFRLVEQSAENNFEGFVDWIRSCYKANFIKLISQSELFYKLSVDAQKSFFTYALQLVRITLLHKLHCPLLQINLTTEKNFIEKFGLNVTIQQLKKITEELVKAYYYLERNGHGKIVYVQASIQIVNIFNGV